MRLLASTLALAVACFYLWVIGREDEGASSRVWFVFGCLVTAALLLLARRALADVAATTLLAAWALLGVFSIGMLLVPSAVMGALSGRRQLALLAPERASVVATGGAAIAVGAVAAGLWLTG